MIDVRLRFSARARPHISHGRAPRARPLTPRRARPRARGNRHARARRFFCLTTVRVLRESLARKKMDVIKREEAKRVAYIVLT